MTPVNEIVDNFESSNRDKFSQNVDFLLESFRETVKQNGNSDLSISGDQIAAIYQTAASLTIGYHIEFATYLGYLGLSKTLDS